MKTNFQFSQSFYFCYSFTYNLHQQHTVAAVNKQIMRAGTNFSSADIAMNTIGYQSNQVPMVGPAQVRNGLPDDRPAHMSPATANTHAMLGNPANGNTTAAAVNNAASIQQNQQRPMMSNSPAQGWHATITVVSFLSRFYSSRLYDAWCVFYKEWMVKNESLIWFVVLTEY